MIENQAYPVTHYIDSIGWGKYQMKLFINCVLTYSNVQACMISIGYFGYEFEQEWGISNKEKGLMGTIYQIGSLLGSYFWGSISDNYGRSFSFKRSIILLIFAGFLWIFSENIIEIYILCFISGIGNIGELVLTPVIFKEFCPIKNVKFATILNVGFPIGGALTAICIIMIRVINSNYLEGWKFLTIIMVFCQILLSIDRIDIDETPGFLVVNQNPQKAEAVLQNVSKINKSSIKIGIIESQENALKNQSRIRILFSKKYIKSTILLSLIYFLILFGTFSILIFMPRFLKNYSLITKYTVIGLQQLSGVPTNFLASYLVNTKLGRTRTLSYSLFIISVMMFLFSLANDLIIIIIVTMIMIGTNSLAYAALFTIPPEVYATEVRNSAQGLFFASSRIGGVSAPLIAGAIIDLDGGQEMCLVMFAIAYFISGICAWFLKETRPELKVDNLISSSS